MMDKIIQPLLIKFHKDEREIMQSLRDAIAAGPHFGRVSEASVNRALVRFAADDPKLLKRLVKEHQE